MAFFDSEAKKRKRQTIALQNIILDIDEKKLQVSEEFLAKMVKIYISRYMKLVNEHLSEMSKASTIGMLFKHYDLIGKNLEMLIKIEPYHKFKRPTPTEYKEQLEERLDDYVNSLIAREWRKIKPSSTGNVREDPALDSKFRKFFNSFSLYKSRMPQGSVELLDRIRETAYPDEARKKEEMAQTEKQTETASDGFVEESFERIPSPGTNEKPGE